MTSKRIDFLDGMRGLAIITVVVYHFFAQIDGVAISDFYNLNTPLYYAYLSVPLFFCISGYVIFMTLDNTATLKGFLIRRWIRLFPAMLIASIVIPIVAYFFAYRFGGVPRFIDIVPGLTFLGANVVSALTGIRTEGLEGGFWTVYVEVRFYVMFGIFYYLLGQRRAFFAMAGLCFALVILIQIASLVGGGYAERAHSLFGKMLIGYHLPWFLLGMYIYLFNFKQHRLLLLLIMLNALIYNSTSFKSVLATLVLIAIIVAAFTTPWAQVIFKSRPLVFLGFVSYPLYLFNDSIGRGIVLALYRNFGEQIPFEVFPLIAFAVIIGPVWFIAKNFEPPMQQWLKRRLLPPKLPQAAAT